MVFDRARASREAASSVEPTTIAVYERHQSFGQRHDSPKPLPISPDHSSGPPSVPLQCPKILPHSLPSHHATNTSAIADEALLHGLFCTKRACSTSGVFAGSASLRSNTPFIVGPSRLRVQAGRPAGSVQSKGRPFQLRRRQACRSTTRAITCPAKAIKKISMPRMPKTAQIAS